MERALQDVFRPHLVHTPHSEDGDVEQNDVLEDALHAGDVVMDDERSLSAFSEPTQVRDEPSFGLVVDPHKGLVEKKNVGSLRESLGEEHPLPLSAREIGEGSVRETRKADQREKGVHLRAPLRSSTSEEEREARVVGQPHLDDVGDGHGEVEVDVVALGNVGGLGLAGPKGGAEDLGGSLLRTHEPKKRPQKGRLACAIGPDEGTNRSLRDFERDPVEGQHATRQTDGQGGGAQSGRHLVAMVPASADTMVFVFVLIMPSYVPADPDSSPGPSA